MIRKHEFSHDTLQPRPFVEGLGPVITMYRGSHWFIVGIARGSWTATELRPRGFRVEQDTEVVVWANNYGRVDWVTPSETELVNTPNLHRDRHAHPNGRKFAGQSKKEMFSAIKAAVDPEGDAALQEQALAKQAEINVICSERKASLAAMSDEERLEIMCEMVDQGFDFDTMQYGDKLPLYLRQYLPMETT